jgi:hypothetical protein
MVLSGQNLNAPFLSISQSSIGYENEGIFLGRVDSLPKLSLVASGTTPNFLKWTGSTLEMRGNIQATGGTIGG